MSVFQRFFASSGPAGRLVARVTRRETLVWAFPVAVGAGWVIWPALDQEMMLDLGLVPDPDRDWKMVQAAKLKRMELVLGPQKALAQPKKPTPDTADEEEKEEEEGQGDAEEEEEGGGDDGDAGEEGGEDKEEGDDDGEEKVAITPVFVPAKGPNLSREDLWDNFSIKSMKMTEDDDDDDDEEDEDNDDDDDE